jgi:hypothetical protein
LPITLPRLLPHAIGPRPRSEVPFKTILIKPQPFEERFENPTPVKAFLICSTILPSGALGPAGLFELEPGDGVFCDLDLHLVGNLENEGVIFNSGHHPVDA